MLKVTWNWKAVGDRIFRGGLVVIKIDAESSVDNSCDERRGLKMIFYNM